MATDLSLQPGEQLHAGLLRVADALIDQALEIIHHPPPDRAGAVHDIRTVIKRLRAMLRLLRPGLEEAWFQRENSRLKKAAGRLAASRDRDSAIAALENLFWGLAEHGMVFKAALAELKRTAAAAEAAGDTQQQLPAVQRYLKLTRSSLRELSSDACDWWVAEQGLSQVYRQCRRRMQRACKSGDDADFHRWRIRVQSLHHELQLLRDIFPKRLGRMIDDIKDLRDLLGLDHDIVVLKSVLSASPDSFGGTQALALMLQCLDSLGGDLRSDAKKSGKRLFALSPKAFDQRLAPHWKKARRNA